MENSKVAVNISAVSGGKERISKHGIQVTGSGY